MITPPEYEEIEPELKRFLNPEKPKVLQMLAKGAAPVPAPQLISCWVYLIQMGDEQLKEAAEKSLSEFPKKNMKAVLESDIPSWVLYYLGQEFKEDGDLIESVLLNDQTPNQLVVLIAEDCSERLCNLIANNQERIIESPEIVFALEQNPNNLKSTTDRLRQFLKLAGIFVPDEKIGGMDQSVAETAEALERMKLEEEAMEILDYDEEARFSLTSYIANLNTGSKVKLALKGNKEARSILIKDANKTVACAVLKSPKITENEVTHYSSFKNVADDVVRAIAKNPTWTKSYAVKMNMIQHPKCPPQYSMQFLKFLNLRDLQNVTRSRTVPGPLRKAAKQLLMTKRK